MPYTVSEVAQLAGVSVRTLHHYDQIGLLLPSGRSEAGYRLYERGDLERLQQILFFRELGFSLEEIGRVMSAPSFDRRAALELQRGLLAEKAVRLQSMIRAVDAALEAMQEQRTMSDQEVREMFGGFDESGEYAAEAERRWGETEAYRESQRRTRRYGKAEWQAIKDEAETVEARLAAVLERGLAPDSREAMDAAEAHRAHIERWFYPCQPEMHRALGEMYVADERFAEHYDRRRDGLARFIRDAIRANADRRAGPTD